MNMTELDAVNWAFEYFHNKDMANACIHCSPAKFSPITFRLAEVLLAHWNKDQDITGNLAQVRHAMGKYELDQGR